MNASGPKFNIRRLEVGELKNPDTDVYIDKDHLLPTELKSAVHGNDWPYYRITPQPESAEQQAERVSYCDKVAEWKNLYLGALGRCEALSEQVTQLTYDKEQLTKLAQDQARRLDRDAGIIESMRYPKKEFTESAEQGEAAKLQIVEGGYYVNRKGEKIGPMKQYKPNFRSEFDWCEESRNRIYKHTGENYDPGEQDLIAPWTEPEPPSAAPASVEPGEGAAYDDQHRPLIDQETRLSTDEYTKDHGKTWKLVGEHLVAIEPKYWANMHYPHRRRIPAPASVPAVEQGWQSFIYIAGCGNT
jgi:hypothetical protein